MGASASLMCKQAQRCEESRGSGAKLGTAPSAGWTLRLPTLCEDRRKWLIPAFCVSQLHLCIISEVSQVPGHEI